MTEALINSSYLILRLSEDIYRRKAATRDFTALEVQAFWNASMRGLGDAEVGRYKTIAYLATATLGAADREMIRLQLPADLWAQFLAVSEETAWPDPLPEIPGDVDLETLRQTSVDKIEREAELARHVLVTPGSGQSMTYQEKALEAQAYLANENIADDEIPHIVAEVGITGQDKFQVATVIVMMREFWKQASPVIEVARLQAKAAVAAATTADEILTAAAVDWDAVKQQILNAQAAAETPHQDEADPE